MHAPRSIALLAALAAAGTAGGACKGKATPPAAESESSVTTDSAARTQGNDRAAPEPAVTLDVELRGLPEDFDATALRAAVDAARSRFSRCYVGRMAARPGLAGTDVFDIAPEDSHLVAQVASTEMKDAPIARCLLARFREIRVDGAVPDAFQIAVGFTPRDKAPR